MKTRLFSITLSVILIFSVALPAFASVPGVTSTMEGASKGMVAASHPLAAEAGIQILEKGGNAIDAAAAVQLAHTVVEPMMSGIGGGGFMMIYLKDSNTITIIDSREKAPMGATPDLFLDENGQPVPFFERHTNGKAVGVPGTLLGLETALKKYGTMNLEEVIDPAIRYTEKGVEVNWITAEYIAQNIDKLEKHGTAAEVFVPNGKPLQEGDLLVQPDLAKTLKLIKKEGSKVFYDGEIGQALVDEVQRLGSSMTMDDLRNYTVAEREPVRAMFREYEIVSMPPPSSGGLTLLQILKFMEGYDVERLGVNTTEYLDRLLQAYHLAYADRAAFMADEDFYPVPKEGLVHPEYLDQRRHLIQPGRASADVQAGDPWAYESTAGEILPHDPEEKPTGETTHFSVMDQWGNMVSYTTTIEAVFGSGIMVPGYGFMLNNELTDFDALPEGVNKVEPGKRPRSSMTPTLVLKDGEPFMALGSPGGATIITSVAQVILNVIDHGLPIQEAITTPRVYSAAFPQVRWEAGIEQDVILELSARGHIFDAEPQNIGNVQAIIFDAESGLMYGGADNTREGTVIGVDNVHFIVDRPAPIEPINRGACTIQVNGAILPFTADQVTFASNVCYVQSDKLLLGLGATEDEIQDAEISLVRKGEQTFLHVGEVAEALGFSISLDEQTNTLSLEKDRQELSQQMIDAYQEDQYKITN